MAYQVIMEMLVKSPDILQVALRSKSSLVIFSSPRVHVRKVRTVCSPTGPTPLRRIAWGKFRLLSHCPCWRRRSVSSCFRCDHQKFGLSLWPISILRGMESLWSLGVPAWRSGRTIAASPVCSRSFAPPEWLRGLYLWPYASLLVSLILARLHYVSILSIKQHNVIKFSDYDRCYFNFRRGHCYIVPVEEAPKYLDDGFKLVMSPTGNGSDQIYITFGPKSTFTKEDVWNYFRYHRLILVVLYFDMKPLLVTMSLCSCKKYYHGVLPASMALSMMFKFHFGRNACLVTWASCTLKLQNKSYKKGVPWTLISYAEIKFLSKPGRKSMN